MRCMESAVPSKCYDNIFKEQIHLKEMHSSRQQIHETNLFFLTLSTALSEDGWTRPVFTNISPAFHGTKSESLLFNLQAYYNCFQGRCIANNRHFKCIFYYKMSIKYKSERNTQLVRNDIFCNAPRPPFWVYWWIFKFFNLIFCVCVMRALFCIWWILIFYFRTLWCTISSLENNEMWPSIFKGIWWLLYISTK